MTASVVPMPTASKRKPVPASTLELRQRTRRALWLLVFFLEVSNAGLLTLFATIYFCHDVRGAFLWVIKVYFLFSGGYHFLGRFSYFVASGYAVLSVAFTYRVLLVILTSVRHKELRFGLKTPVSIGPSINDTRGAHPTVRAGITRWFSQLRESIGVHGQYFEARLLADEVVELVAQILAARSSSQSISSVPLNQIYGVVILLNSIATPVFQRVFSAPADLVKQRVARILTDLVLDFVWGTLLPIWMYGPIVKQYWAQKDHGDSIDFTENSAREVERVLVLSWWSFVLSVIPFCNSLLNLLEVRALLREEVVTAACTMPGHQQSRSTLRLVLSQEDPRSRVESKTASGRPTAEHLRRLARSHVFHVLHILIGCVGVCVFLISVFASGIFGFQSHESAYGCVHRVHPWFTTREACIGRTIDCASLGINGSNEEVDAALGVFDASSLADLFVSNCAALNLSTSSLQRFGRLQTLEITNSSIVGWDRDVSSLSSERFGELRTVKLKGVTLATPAETIALFTTPLSKSAEWVFIADTDMSEALVSEELVGSNWKHLIYFDCANCALRAFPTQVVESMGRLIMLSLIDNDIDVVPSSWPPAGVQLVMVWFDGNARLTELPDSMWRQGASSLQSVYIQGCGVASLPSWVGDAVATNAIFEIYAYGSPICDGGSGRSGDSGGGGSSGGDRGECPSFVSCVTQDL